MSYEANLPIESHLSRSTTKIITGVPSVTPDEWRNLVKTYWSMKCEFADARPVTLSKTYWFMGQLRFGAGEASAQEWTWMPDPTDGNWRNEMVVVRIIQRGVLDIEQSGVRLQLTEGSMLLLDPRRRFTQTMTGDAAGMSVRVPRRALEQRGIRLCEHSMFAADPASHEVRLLRGLLESTAEHGRGMSAANRAHVGEHLIDLMSILVCADPTAPRRIRSPEVVLAKATRFMERNIGNERIDVKAIAHGIGVSPGHLSKMFTNSGTSVMRFLWQLRLQRAHALLCDPQLALRMSEVASQCGFVNAAHFSRAFKQHYGATPRETRRKPDGPQP
jgi:AraC family transcriptional regulator, positive regulator of tynA and feaB